MKNVQYLLNLTSMVDMFLTSVRVYYLKLTAIILFLCTFNIKINKSQYEIVFFIGKTVYLYVHIEI